MSVVVLLGSLAAFDGSRLPVSRVGAAAKLRKTLRAAAMSVAGTGLLMSLLTRLAFQLCRRLWLNVALRTHASILSLVAWYLTRYSVAILYILPYLMFQLII